MKKTNNEQEVVTKPPLHQWIDYYKAFGLGSFFCDEYGHISLLDF